MTRLTAKQRTETKEAVELIEANLLHLLKQGSSWSASANLRLIRQLKKTLNPLVQDG